MSERLPETLDELQRLERRIEREWWWINGALHAVAQMQADGPRSVDELRSQARLIDARRVAIAVRMAEFSRRSEQR